MTLATAVFTLSQMPAPFAVHIWNCGMVRVPRSSVATLLSARTQDATTLAASTRLFKVARTPRTMAKLTVRQIEKLIYPVSFYRNKAKNVKATCQLLVDRFGGRVPTTMEELLMLPGVGRKTANLVLILAFKSLRNICVELIQAMREMKGVAGVHIMAYRQEESVAEIVDRSGVLQGRLPWYPGRDTQPLTQRKAS